MLLDTHVCLWLLAAPDRIGAEATKLIGGTERVFVSSISVAEVEIKRLTGKLAAPPDFLALVIDAGVTLLPLTGDHASGLARRPELVRHDPFDRLLVAQADHEQIPFVTADRLLLSLADDRFVDARR